MAKVEDFIPLQFRNDGDSIWNLITRDGTFSITSNSDASSPHNGIQRRHGIITVGTPIDAPEVYGNIPITSRYSPIDSTRRAQSFRVEINPAFPEAGVVQLGSMRLEFTEANSLFTRARLYPEGQHVEISRQSRDAAFKAA